MTEGGSDPSQSPRRGQGAGLTVPGGGKEPRSLNTLAGRTGLSTTIDRKGFSGALANRAKPPDPEKRTAALGVGARDGGWTTEAAGKRLHRGPWTAAQRGSSALFGVGPKGPVVAPVASLAEARALLNAGGLA